MMRNEPSKTTRATTAELDKRVSRDQRNAEVARQCARAELRKFRALVSPEYISGPTEHDRNRARYDKQRREALEAITTNPFQVMVEVYTEVTGDNGNTRKKKQLWYANELSSVNEVFKESDIAILAWTHPGIQLALTTDLGDYRDIQVNGLRLRSVEPLAKARFDSVLPQISAVYQPGGAVRPQKAPVPSTGLKAVKLEMTKDQVKAFISRMSGLMVITGAPGSGKTTVAFQRIRFLFDQQELQEPSNRLVKYTPEQTRVFLANENLAEQAEDLLANQLNIPNSVVESIGNYLDIYLDKVWRYKHNARPRQRKLSHLDAAARAAVLGLSDHHDLVHLWETYERQVAGRLATSTTAAWMTTDRESGGRLKILAETLSRVAGNVTLGHDPANSGLTMGGIYSKVSRTYTEAREGMPTHVRNRFDELFQQWLFRVYDPLSAVAAYFGGRESEAAYRMRQGTGARVNEAEILEQAKSEWADRVYGPEDRAWLAWLLRFALPEATDPQARFREMPSSIEPAMTDGERWTHVVIDEAQDLSVAEASLLGSLVHPDGALTVSADFQQIVSPVHGMTSADALRVSRSLREKRAEQQYPFARNMRQSAQIGRFLQGFYEVAFGQRPTFDINAALDDKKPQLVIAPPRDHTLRIKQIWNVFMQSGVVSSLAVLQINEDEQALKKLRAELEEAGVPLAPAWAASGTGLCTTSVERIKGLEFDACIVLGLEDVERASLNFTINRAYVALSRPARRLALICGEYPPLLRKVDKALFDVTQS